MKRIYLPSFCLLLTGLISCSQSTPPVKKPAADSNASAAITAQSAAPKTKLIGVWLDESIKSEQGQQIAYQLVRLDKKTYLQVITFSGKKLDIDDNPPLSPSATELKQSGQQFISTEPTHEIFSFSKSGELEVYDKTGLIMKCKRML
jgi:hypothetical protein